MERNKFKKNYDRIIGFKMENILHKLTMECTYIVKIMNNKIDNLFNIIHKNVKCKKQGLMQIGVTCVFF